MNACKSLAGTCAPSTIRLCWVCSRVTGASSLSGSKDMPLYRLGLMTICAAAASKRVWPSGAARTPPSGPLLPPAPRFFSPPTPPPQSPPTFSPRPPGRRADDHPYRLPRPGLLPVRAVVGGCGDGGQKNCSALHGVAFGGGGAHFVLIPASLP